MNSLNNGQGRLSKIVGQGRRSSLDVKYGYENRRPFFNVQLKYARGIENILRGIKTSLEASKHPSRHQNILRGIKTSFETLKKSSRHQKILEVSKQL